jgi:hypothetical protein
MNTAGLTQIIHELSQPGVAWLKNILNAMDYWNVEPQTMELTDCIFTETAKVSRNMFFSPHLPGIYELSGLKYEQYMEIIPYEKNLRP